MEDLEDQATEEALDQVLDQVMGTTAADDYCYPSTAYTFIWTNLAVWGRVIQNMVGAAILCFFLRHYYEAPSIEELLSPIRGRRGIEVIAAVWKLSVPMVTMALLLHLLQAYSYWKELQTIARAIPGRIYDINLLLATHAARQANGLVGRFNKAKASTRASTSTSDSVGSDYTPLSHALLEEVSHKLQLMHLFYWATQYRPFQILLTNRGLTRMVTRGLLTIPERNVLERQSSVISSQRGGVLGSSSSSSVQQVHHHHHIILLEWVVLICQDAQKRNLLAGGCSSSSSSFGMEQVLLEQVCALGRLMRQFESKRRLLYHHQTVPYVRLVQVLVRWFLFVAPLALYADHRIDDSGGGGVGSVAGIWTIVLSIGWLTWMYGSVCDLAASYIMDPLVGSSSSTERYFRSPTSTSTTLDIAALIRESNEASQLFTIAARTLPWWGSGLRKNQHPRQRR